MSEAALLGKCREKIEDRLGWGPADRWTNADFESLSETIAEATAVNLSPTTLKRVWGRVAYSSSPSTTTLDALAVFAGYENYRSFRSAVYRPGTDEAVEKSANNGSQKSPLRYALLLLPVLLLAVVVLAFLPGTSVSPAPPPQEFVSEDFSFSVRPVTTGFPNSVVFTYEATAAGDSAVFLQQNWDSRRREKLDALGNTHTSIYHLPGFYQAKLVVGQQVVREQGLFLPSEGWVAIAGNEKSPVYLKPEEVRQVGQLAITPQVLERYGIAMQPTVPSTAFVNVRELDGLRTDNFTFRTRIRHTYAEGSAACRHARVTVMLKDGAIILPFSAPGCIADLGAYVGGQFYDGEAADLSAFGVMKDGWTDLSVTGTTDSLFVRINQSSVMEVARQEAVREIIGLQYDFLGTGAVDELTFDRDGEVIWAESF
ncbi:MAG: hypothetical protein WA952_02360 [Lewinella sp.]